jgi:cytidine deaminase
LEESRNLKFQCELKAIPFAELNAEERELAERCLKARDNSRAPYSNFPVGAALLLKNGEHIIGANQENAAYPSGLCAERTALFAAGVNYPGVQIEALAVSIPDHAPHIPFPCGGCLQVMAEYEYAQKQALKVYLVHSDREWVYLAEGTRHLLPFSFNESHLPK